MSASNENSMLIDTLAMGWKHALKVGLKPVCWFAIALALTVLTNACNLGQTQSLKPLRIGTVVFPGYDIALYAQISDIFKQRGLEVDFQQFDNALDTNRAVMRGGLDAAFTTLWDVMLGDPGNSRPVVLMTLDVSAGADGIFSRPEIKSVADLRGKKVAAMLGGSAHLTLLEALKAHQVSPSEVQIMDYSNDVAAEKIKRGEIDAAVLWEPVLGQTAKSVKGNVVSTTKQLDSLVIDTLVSSEKVVNTKKAELKQFMLAWFDVMHAVETQPKKVFDSVGQQLGQSGDSFASDYAGLKKGDIALNQRMFAPEGRLKSAMTEINQLFKVDPRNGRIIRQDVEIDATLVNEAIAGWQP